MVKILKVFILLFITSLCTSAQSNNIIRSKSKELISLQNDISVLENELNSKSQLEKKNLKTLKKIEQQSLYLNKLINKYSKEEKNLESKIQNLDQEIKRVDTKLSQLKKEYSEYIIWLYESGKFNYLKLLVNAKSMNQALLRYKYLKYINEKSNKVVYDLRATIKKNEGLKKSLEKTKLSKHKIINRKISEQSLLSKRKNQKENLIKSLSQDQTALEAEINSKRLAETIIKNLITREIEKERARLARLREDKLKNRVSPKELDYSYDNFENFAGLQGKLNWPVYTGDIIRKFGENENKRLKTVTLNYGIDISTNHKDDVLSVAEGIVSAIDWLPGYGSVLIITHKGNFRTVYGHLTDIIVDEGDFVIGGQLLGKVSQSLEGNIVHFEIWNERNYQNPESWLVKNN